MDWPARSDTSRATFPLGISAPLEGERPVCCCPTGRRAVVYGAHSLRHFFVSVATAAGMPAAMVKSITGHATDSMLEHYQHIGAGLASELAVRISVNGASRPIPPALTPMGVDAQGADLAALKQAVRGIAERMTEKTWKTARSELLSMLA